MSEPKKLKVRPLKDITNKVGTGPSGLKSNSKVVVKGQWMERRSANRLLESRQRCATMLSRGNETIDVRPSSKPVEGWSSTSCPPDPLDVEIIESLDSPTSQTTWGAQFEKDEERVAEMPEVEAAGSDAQMDGGRVESTPVAETGRSDV